LIRRDRIIYIRPCGHVVASCPAACAALIEGEVLAFYRAKPGHRDARSVLLALIKAAEGRFAALQVYAFGSNLAFTFNAIGATPLPQPLLQYLRAGGRLILKRYSAEIYRRPPIVLVMGLLVMAIDGDQWP